MPPEFPALTMISLRARTVRWLPASKRPEETVLPSAVIEIQESSRAWTTSVNSPGDAAGRAGAKLGDALGATGLEDPASGELAGEEPFLGKTEVGEVAPSGRADAPPD